MIAGATRALQKPTPLKHAFGHVDNVPISDIDGARWLSLKRGPQIDRLGRFPAIRGPDNAHIS